MIEAAKRDLIVQRIREGTEPGPKQDYLIWKWTCGLKHNRRRTQFYRNVVTIPDKHSNPPGNPIPLRMNRAQRDQERWRLHYERRGDPVRFATLKARQFGLSTFWTAAGFELVTNYPNTSALIVADETETAFQLLEKVKVMRDNAPVVLATQFDNRERMKFDPPVNSSLVIKSAASPNPGRGKTYALVHATEPAFWRDPERRVLSLQQSVPTGPGTTVSWESSAIGEGNWWHDFWWDAKRGRNDHHAFFYPWFYDATFDYCFEVTEEEGLAILDEPSDSEVWLISQGCTAGQLAWRRWALRNLMPSSKGAMTAEEWFAQEYPATPEEAFLSSGRPVYDAHLIMRARGITARKPVWTGDLVPGPKPDHGFPMRWDFMASGNGDVRIWEQPKEGLVYAAGIDGGEGHKDSDWSVVVLCEVETGNQVATLRARIETGAFGRMAACLCSYYNGAYALPEMKQSGLAIFESMTNYGYHMVGRRPEFGKVTHKRGQRMGWDTNSQTKPLMILKVRQALALRGEGCAVRDTDLLDELRALIRDDRGAYKAGPKSHDDYHDAWAICLWAREDAITGGLLDEAREPDPVDYEGRHWADFRRAVALGEKRLEHANLELELDDLQDLDEEEETLEWII